MEIRIRETGTAAAIASLPDVPALRSRITQAIRLTIKDGKSEGSSLVKRRYTARSMLSLGKIKMRTTGLKGTLTISGGRNKIKLFKLNPSTRPPHNPPGGLHVQIVRGQGGSLAHAFVNRGGAVLERTGRARLPLRRLNTVSLPGAFSRVGDKLMSSMASKLQTRLEELL